ncbi:uncharacterized protein LOC116251272 isoform X2 [Nymphaea colorata]|nr:uncharacterized protein LOC116251272 isoform X2 [Nymphaea colorata]
MTSSTVSCFMEMQGGGRSSARKTIGRVTAGAVTMKLLNDVLHGCISDREARFGTISCFSNITTDWVKIVCYMGHPVELSGAKAHQGVHI